MAQKVKFQNFVYSIFVNFLAELQTNIFFSIFKNFLNLRDAF